MTKFTLTRLRKITRQFGISIPVVSVSRLGSGHINDSFRVHLDLPGQEELVLQRINHCIFKDITGLSNNIVIVTRHIEQEIKANPDKYGHLRALHVILAKDGKPFYRDEEGNFWRMFNYIGNSRSYDRVTDTRIAFEGGKGFGSFMLLTEGIDASTLSVTIPRFHDIDFRLDHFHLSIRRDNAGRVAEAGEEIDFASERAGVMRQIRNLGDEGRLPLRVTHNDTKFNNILFDKEDRAVCIVDLDTVMPGYILYDFGDAIRTGANTGEEDEKDLSKAGINLELFEAYTGGYLSIVKDLLTATEKENLAFSALFMTYIIGLRFLTDYLDGDIYYRIAFPGHNLQRARAQFALLKDMEKNFDKMKKIIDRLF